MARVVDAVERDGMSALERPSVVRWGQSAYETDEHLALEERTAKELGLSWKAYPTSSEPPDLTDVGALVVTSKVEVDASVLARFEGSLVLTTTSGFDHIDRAAAVAQGIQVGRCPMARRDPVVEHSIGTLIGLLRRLPAQQDAARAGRWARGEVLGWTPVSLSDAKVLVVGLGVIGSRVAELLGHFGVEVWGTDPVGVPADVRAVDLDRALPQVDAVTLHCSLNDTSRGLLSANRIGRLQPHAVIVNTARGALLDVDAAVAAVRDQELGGLAVDVFPEEPWPGLENAARVPGVWLTPHASGVDRSLGARVATEVGASLTAWAKGDPLPHPVSVSTSG
ncbi:MAG: NAD(P)-dependent oxidoreductase [Myxococcota bacterium]